MKTNEGNLDRAARVVLGLVLVTAAIVFPNVLGSWTWLLWIGIVPIVTGIVGWCPLYAIFGLSTCPVKKA